MSGDRHMRLNGPVTRPRNDRSSRAERSAARPAGRSSSRQARRGLVIFACGLVLALGVVLMLIAAGTVQALPHTAALNAKADGWVGLAATVSVLASAAAGVMLVQRYVNSRRR